VSKFAKPSPALLIAMLALFVAIGGSGFAAGHAGGTAKLTAAKKAAKAKRGPRGHRGPRGFPGSRGPAGALGPQGAAGADGKNGKNGTPAFGAVLGRGVDVPSGTWFLAPTGQLNPSPNENNVSSFTPNAPVTVSDLAVSLSVAPGPGQSRTFTIRAGNQDTPVTCTVPEGNSVCTTDKSITLAPFVLISIGSTTSGGPSNTDVRFGWRATAG
jgi:collagen triple helix repeat protein